MEPVRPIFQEAPVQMPPDALASPPTSSQPNELQKSKLRHKLSFLLPAIVVLGSIFGGVLIADWVLRNRQMPEPTSTPAPSLAPATPVPTMAPAAQMKTYRNHEQGFSFAYPDTLALVECANGVRLFQSFPEDVTVTDTCNSNSGGVMKVYYDRQPIVTSLAEESEEVIKVAGYDALSIQSVSESAYLRQVTFVRDRVYYAIELSSQSFADDFEQLLASLKFIGDSTKDWTFYDNSVYGYQISYPQTWKMLVSAELKDNTEAKNVEFRKSEVDAKKGSLALEADSNVADANLTASEVISSTKNLQGWTTSPSLELRKIGGGTAQVLQGQFNGHYQTFIVVWYKNRLVQMVWNDEVGQPNEEILQGFLSTFRFN